MTLFATKSQLDLLPVYLFVMHFFDSVNGHGLLHELDGGSVELVVGSLGDLDAEDESVGLEEGLELGLSCLRSKTADDKACVVVHVLLIPGLVIDLDFLTEELLVIHHLDGLKACLGRAVLDKSDSSGLLGDQIPLDFDFGDFSKVLEGLEEHSLVYLRREIDNKDFLTLGPLYLGHL